MEKIGGRIKELRKDNKLTQEQFGEKIGLKDSAVSMLERNERNLTQSVIKNILTQFCVNEAWLKQGVGEKYSQDLLKMKSLYENKPNSANTALLNKQLALFDKLKSLGSAEQEEVLNVLGRLYSVLFIPELKEGMYEYTNLLRLDLLKTIKSFVSDFEVNKAMSQSEAIDKILSNDEEAILTIYRKLTPKDKDEVLSFLNFKNSNNDLFKKNQKSSNSEQTEEAATVQLKIG